MELSDIQIYIALIVGTGASVTFGISGLKYLYNRYTNGLDTRISGCINKKMESITEVQNQHSSKIKSLEDRFNDFWRYLKKVD